MGNHKGANLAFATGADRTGRARRHGGQQVEHAVLFFHNDLASAHRFDRKEVQSLHAAVAIGDDVDGRGQRCHRKRGGIEGIVHGGES